MICSGARLRAACAGSRTHTCSDRCRQILARCSSLSNALLAEWGGGKQPRVFERQWGGGMCESGGNDSQSCALRLVLAQSVSVPSPVLLVYTTEGLGLNACSCLSGAASSIVNGVATSFVWGLADFMYLAQWTCVRSRCHARGCERLCRYRA